MSRRALSGLYLVAGAGLPVATAETWLLPGVALVQYRDKRADDATRRREAAILRTLCSARRAIFIVNDDVALAAYSGADGVHLGKQDATVKEARAALGKDAVIGASCHDSLERACAAQREGADYVAFGSLFASGTKPGATRVTPDTVAHCKRQLTLPVCVIGGITRANLDRALATGADMIAVHADVAGAPDPADAVRHYLARLARPAPGRDTD